MPLKVERLASKALFSGEVPSARRDRRASPFDLSCHHAKAGTIRLGPAQAAAPTCARRWAMIISAASSSGTCAVLITRSYADGSATSALKCVLT